MKILNQFLFHNKLILLNQDTQMFNYSIESILIANFTTLNSKIKKVIDLGTNNGIIPILLSQRKPTLQIMAVDIEPSAVILAQENIAINGLTNVTIVHDCIKNLSPTYRNFDLIICNPPFFKINTFKLSNNDLINVARFEQKINLTEIIHAASLLAHDQSYFTLVFVADRLDELMFILQNFKFTVKRMQFIYPTQFKNAKMVLIESVYHGKSKVIIAPPIYINDHAEYSLAIKNIFTPLK